MKKLILKWLGLENALTFSHSDFIDDCVSRLLARRYDLEGMERMLDDIDYLTQDLESRGNRWDDMADKVEDGDSDTFLLDKVQSVDDRLTELVAGYKLDVQLVKEEF
jgi:hypothetical protein